MLQNRTRLITWLVVIALVVGAGIGGWTFIKGKANEVAAKDPGVPSTPTEEGVDAGGGNEDATGQPSAPPNAEKEQESEQVAQCAGPLPEQSRVQYTKLPEGELGEWVSVKNELGKEALRFKVDLLGTQYVNREIPIIASLFSLTVENLSCEDLKWPVERGGLWLSWREPHPKDVRYAWVSSATSGGSTHISINVQRHGELNIKEDSPKNWIKTVLDKKFGKHGLKELPDPVRSNQTGEAEILIIVKDPYRKTGPLAPIGLYKDGRLHLSLGGELSWALIDLGRAEDWMKK